MLFQDKYFGKNIITEYKCTPCKKNQFITDLRKAGDLVNQYVTNIYYCDTLSFSYDNSEVYSIYNISDPVYSCYHSECDHCVGHKQKVKQNLIVGFKIYPNGIKPEQNFQQRVIYWKQFQK